MRILHAPANVGGHPIGLSKAERELGLESEVVIFEPDPFAFEVDRSLARPGIAPWRTAPARLRFLAEALRRYDVFHFNFGSALFPVWTLPIAFDELPLLRRLGKTVIATFQGDDARPPEYSQEPYSPELMPTLQRRRANARARMLRYAHRVFYLNPDLGRWLPGAAFCPYASFDPREVEPIPPRQDGELTVVHAPSHRAVKGTEAVVAVMDALRARGAPLRLDLVEGVTRAEALARCARADIAIDQLRVGWYGGFALEAMALGKPVLCYINEESPFGEELPIVATAAETLERDLVALLESRGRLAEIGAASRSFVERHHDPRNVARLVLEGLVPLPERPGTGDSLSGSCLAGGD
ncbi:MAG TPA: glycosyltransferase [Chloroflexota bacterium]|nr:glycosyltransferase [Chloroflexota bacterium]